jgi:hypothetical protein
MAKPRKTGIKTASAKAKGRKFQQHVRDRILKMFPWLREGDVESRSMGAGGVDIMMSPVARRTLPLSIECKKTKATPSRAQLEQSQANVVEGTIPCVIWCPHGKGADKAMIMFDFDEFLGWYKERQNESDL